MTNRTTVVCLIAVLGVAACGQDNPEPAPNAAEAMPPVGAPVATDVGYACESGRTLSVRYPDTQSAQLAYEGRTYALKIASSASGARYAGDGVEWWTATRDGQESGTLSRSGPNAEVGGAVLERCSRPTPGAVVQPGPALPPVPAPTAIPALAPCKGPQLKLSADGGDAGMGHRVSIIGVTNTGAQACSLTGYPTVTLQDARNRPLTSIRADQNPGSYLRSGQTPAPVTLAANGKAFFDLAWTVVPHEGEGETTCPSAARVRMTAPGDTAPVTLAQAFTPCGGRIDVSPFRAVAEPAPAST